MMKPDGVGVSTFSAGQGDLEVSVSGTRGTADVGLPDNLGTV